MMRRFCRYIEKVFHIGKLLATIAEPRIRPQISAVAIWLSVLVLFATRRGSLHALESELRVPGRLDALIGARKPSADTIGRVLAGMEPDSLLTMLACVIGRLGRNKALISPWPLRFVAVDGHEFFSLS